MFAQRLARSLFVVIVALALTPPVMAGSLVKVSTIFLETDYVLSDLIVYGDNGQKKTFLELNNPGDDITLHPGDIKTFDAGFEITKYFVSTTVGNSEFESICFFVVQTGPKEIGHLLNTSTNESLVPLIDYGTAVSPPPIGTTLDFVDGLNASMTGWFIGTGFNVDDGTVTGAFTGTAEIVANGLLVQTIPEPSSLAMAGIAALAGLGAWSRRRGW